MNKAERLLQLLTLLRARRGVVTARALAERLGVSERTIYRDIQSLTLSGIAIEGEAGVGYRLQPGCSLPPLMFTGEEIEALLLGVRMVQGWGDDELVQSADSALQKIRSVLPDRMIHNQNHQKATLLVPELYRVERARHGALLRQAIKHRQVVCLEYQDEKGVSSSRRVNPLGLVYWGAAWTLVAWCQLRNDHRLFRLDRIKTAEIHDQTFTVEPNQTLETYIRQYKPDFTGLAF